MVIPVKGDHRVLHGMEPFIEQSEMPPKAEGGMECNTLWSATLFNSFIMLYLLSFMLQVILRTITCPTIGHTMLM